MDIVPSMIFSTQPPSSAFGSGPESSFNYLTGFLFSFFQFRFYLRRIPCPLLFSPKLFRLLLAMFRPCCFFRILFLLSSCLFCLSCSPDTAVASAGRLFAHPLTIATAARTGRKAESTCLLPSVFFSYSHHPFQTICRSPTEPYGSFTVSQVLQWC